jgi:SIR2-like domain
MLPEPLDLYCIGGFVIYSFYGLPRPTGDIDYYSAVPANLNLIPCRSVPLLCEPRQWALGDPDRQVSRVNTFITFNYDLLLDDALRKIQNPPEYHLPKLLTVLEHEEPKPPTCSVLKLHGSTNWGICSSCRERVVVLTEKVTASPLEFRARACPNCGQSAFQPMLVPPSWDKSEYREVMKPIWAKAVDELKQASRVCIIGYSTPETDSFFK